MERRRSRLFAALGIALAVWIVAGPVAAANGSVRIGEADERYFFRPLTTYANVGGSVTWRNGTDADHTVTSDSGTELDSANIGEGKTFTHTFSATGTFTYHCSIHDYMVGKVVILAAGVALPATDTAPVAAYGPGSESVGLTLVVLAGLAGAGLALRRYRRTI